MSNNNNTNTITTNDNRIEYNNRIFKLLADYNGNINTYNNNINFIITNLIRRNNNIVPTTTNERPTTTTTNERPTASTTNERPTASTTNNTHQFSNISDILNTHPLTGETSGPTLRPTTTTNALDNYLVRILELLNANSHTNTQSDNDLTISFSFMRELDDTTVPVYELISTRQEQEQQVTPLIYDNTTRLIYYEMDNDNVDRICPITHEAFEDGELITQIRECGHIFKTDSIKRWLERSAYCPKCRYNIVTRQYTPPISQPPPTPPSAPV
jgi:hypothetical protein